MTVDPTWLDEEPASTRVVFGAFGFDLRGDTLADITFDGSPLLRAIRFVVRDQDWATVPGRVTKMERVTVSEGATGFGFTVANAAPGIEYSWTARVSVRGDSLSVDVAGRADSAFSRARIGIVVLHPPTVAGVELGIEHPEGSVTPTAFPVEIAPHQPAHDIRALSWTADGVSARLGLSGEVFEMEDQRNWTDASFKTYSTPLAEPWPVDVAAGDTVSQRVELVASRVAPAAPREPGVLLTPSARTMPQIVLGASTSPDPLAAAALPDVPLLVELDADATTWSAALRRAAEGGHQLDVRLIAYSPAQLDPLLDAVAAHRVMRIGVFHPKSHVSEPELWTALVAGAAERSIDAELVGGVRSHFTELNRNHSRLPAGLTAVAFSITPQMHDLERAQVQESLRMLRLVADQAVNLAGVGAEDLDAPPVHVGPVTLRARFNAVAITPRPLPPGGTLDHGYGAELVRGATDPRQRSHGYAAWLVGSAAALAVPGVASVAYAETVGDRGLSDASGRFPASYAVEWLAALVGGEFVDAGVDAVSGSAAVVAASIGKSVTVLLANPWDAPAVVTLAATPSSVERFGVGDDSPVTGEAADRLVVAPGEILRLEL